MATRKVPPPDGSLARAVPKTPGKGGLPDPASAAERTVHKSFGPVERRILASLHGRDLPELERLLLYPDLNVHQRNLGRVILLTSCKEGWAHVVRQLMRLGVDPNKAVKPQDVKNTGMSALAADAEHAQLPLVVAAQAGRADIIRALVDEGNADVNARNGEGWTALEAAAYWAREEAVRTLVDRGAMGLGTIAVAADDSGPGWEGAKLWESPEGGENAPGAASGNVSGEASVESSALQTPAGSYSNLFQRVF